MWLFLLARRVFEQAYDELRNLPVVALHGGNSRRSVGVFRSWANTNDWRQSKTDQHPIRDEPGSPSAAIGKRMDPYPLAMSPTRDLRDLSEFLAGLVPVDLDVG